MAPRGGAFVKIVSPNSGNISIPSRSASLCMRSHYSTRDYVTQHDDDDDGSSKSGSAHASLSSRQHSTHRARDSRVHKRRHDDAATTAAAAAAVTAERYVELEHVRAMLDEAGTHVLRKGVRVPSVAAADAVASARDHADDVASRRSTEALRLPARVPPRTRRQRCRSDDDVDASVSRHSDSSRSVSRQLDPRKRARGDAPSHTTTAAATSNNNNNNNSDRDRAVCPAMFTGLSAVPLSAQLFDDDDDHDNSDTTHTRATSAAQTSRGCVRPLWTLVGTYKSALCSIVDVDGAHDCVRWHQRNPHGGRQQLRVPLHAVYEAVVTAVTHTVARPQQQQQQQTMTTYTLVVRAHARPSQVVFGFATRAEAAHMRALLRSSSLSS